MNIAICDDEKIICEQIKRYIYQKKTDCCMDTYSSGEDLLNEGKTFDLIFLDIQMDGMNGIEAAKKLRERQEESVLIFVTGIKEYVFEAFDVSAFHYLLKPIKEQKFIEVFERAIVEVEKQKQKGQETLFVKTRNHSFTLDQSNILYIESRGKKVEICTEKEVIEAYAGMGELERELCGSFYRCHRGYLVNMAYIAEYDKKSISLSNGVKIFLAKDRYNEFVKEYMRYLRNGGTACV